MVKKPKRKKKIISQKKERNSERLKKLFEYASDGLLLVDSQAKLTGVNQNFIRLTGFRREELIGKPLNSLFRFETPHRKPLEEWLKKKRYSGTTSFSIRTRSGGEKYVTVHIETLPGVKKEFLISVHDITEERKLSLELRKTKEFLENLIQNSLQAIIAADMDGNIIIFNQAAEQLTGFKAEEVIGKKNIVDLYAPGAARSIMKKLRSPLYGGVGRLETSHNVLISKTGEEIPTNMTASIIYDAEGRELATVGMYQDLRERIEIEKRLRQAQERLLESKQKEAIMALAGTAAHELNQPLTSIMGYTEILKNSADRFKEITSLPENLLNACQNAIKAISEQAERMAEIIKKLGELSEIETREYTGKQKILDLEKAGQKERRLLQALALVQSAIVVMDEELLIREAYGKAREIFGENPEGRSLSRYFEGVNYTQLMELVEKAKTKGLAQEELILHSASGKNLRVRIEIERTENQQFLLSITDITDLREREIKLKELSAFREELFENLPVPLLLFDSDGKITYLTREAEKMFGYKTEELKGKLPSDLVKGFEPNTFWRLLRQLRSQGKLEGKLWVQDRAGREFLLYHFDRVMRDPEGEVVGYLSFLVDLSEKHLLEQALAEKTNYLEAIQNNTEILLRATDWEDALTSMLAQLRKLLAFDFAGLVPLEPTERGLYFLRYEPETGEKSLYEMRLYENLDFALNLLLRPEIVYREEFNENTFSNLTPGVEEINQDLLARGIRSFVVVPLKFQEESVGSLFLGHREPKFYQPEKIQRIQPIIDQLALALSHYRHNVRAEKQKQALLQRNLFLEKIIEQTQKIELHQEESQIFSQFLDLFQGVFPRAHLWLAWRDEKRDLVVKGVSNLNPQLLGTRLNLNSELVENLISSAQPLSFEPAEAQLGFLENSKSILLVPMISGRELLGLMGVESHHKEPFWAEEKFLLQLFSRYLALIIPNLLRIRQAYLLSHLQEILIENTSVFIVMYDPQNRISLINQSAAKRLGKTKEEIIGMKLDDFIQRYLVAIEDSKGEKLSAEKIRSELLKGKRLANVRVKFRTESGELIETLSSSDPLFDEAGNLLGIITIGQDLSPLKELEAKLVYSERLAGLGQMAAGIAHELNNPLQAIITSSEMIKRKLEELGEKDLAHRTETVIKASERIQRLAQNLMNYTRPTGEAPQEIELKKLVDEVLSFIGYDLRKNGVQIENRVPENLPQWVAFKDQIEQVLINLLSNAGYACMEKGGGKVVIKARVKGQMLEIQVQDNGVGIPPENLKRIFEPFFTTKPREKGTGLGLNIVQAIVERHQGKIQVKSKPGEGTLFSLFFPLQKTSQN